MAVRTVRREAWRAEMRRSWSFLLLATALLPGIAKGAEGPASEVGRWGGLFNAPVSTTHVTLLPTGKVQVIGEFDEGTRAWLWDPATSAFEELPPPGYNIFCSGHSLLADGRLFFSGGHTATHVGLANASIFDPIAGTWTRLPDMNDLRWYPSTITLANGDALVLSGEVAGTGMMNPLPQVFSPKTGAWRDLTGAVRSVPYYMRMFVAPNGKVLTVSELSSFYLDTEGAGSWTKITGVNLREQRVYGSGVMYEPGKVLIAGGVNPPTNTAEIIDLNVEKPRWSYTGSMKAARRQQNATLLPDGRVLVTGGSSGEGFNNRNAPVNFAEVWDPKTGLWSEWATAGAYRGYHSTGLLLPDGRVFTGGGRGLADETNQLFEPPYLFLGSRPELTSAPEEVEPAQRFEIGVVDAPSIARVTFVRLGSVTHSWDMNQRFLELSYEVSGEAAVSVIAPANYNVAPPGHYMLFVLDAKGAPSVAKIVRLGNEADRPRSLPDQGGNPEQGGGKGSRGSSCGTLGGTSLLGLFVAAALLAYVSTPRSRGRGKRRSTMA